MPLRKVPAMTVSIDIGNTFTGYAYHIRGEREPETFNTSMVSANQTWSQEAVGLLAYKTPTCILLTSDKAFEAFGYEAENAYLKLVKKKEHERVYYFERFKMKTKGEWVSIYSDIFINNLAFKQNEQSRTVADLGRYR